MRFVTDAVADQWSEWLLRGRDVDDEELRRRSAAYLAPVRDRVLEAAALRPADVVLDVGAGAGLLGFGALARLGPAGRVVFSDVSDALLRHCRETAAGAGESARCAFVHASADRLEGVADASVDVVVLRSVLIYVADWRSAFAAFARVLRPEGRVSLFEPLNGFFSRAPTSVYGWDVAPVADLAARVLAVFSARRPPGPHPMTELTAGDLVDAAERAGFPQVSCQVGITSGLPVPGDEADVTRTLRSPPNPTLPSLADAAHAALSPAEATVFLDAVADAVRSGRGRHQQASAYVQARHLPLPRP